MSFISKLCSNASLQLGSQQLWIPSVTSVRYRYHKDKIERGPLHRLGYQDKLLTHGLLPRSKEFTKVTRDFFVPKDFWSEKEALFGRNDYIDILGDPKIRPIDVCYSVPYWLRGFQGNEFQMLIRRKKILGAKIKEYEPCKYIDMEKRITKLYRLLNYKRKDNFWKGNRSTK